METVNTSAEFSDYFSKHVDAESIYIEKESRDREAFLNEYPISRLKELTVDEYCLGTEKSKESLCYLIEFGRYKHTGFGIGGGSARKFGVFYSKAEHCYKHGSDSISDIEKFWPQFRDEMYRFLTESGSADRPLILEEYPLLQGMALVLTKFLCIYYPQKYFSIGSYSILIKLMDRFHYDYDSDMRCHQLNFYFNKDIRADVTAINNVDSLYLGRILWKFINGKSYVQKKTKESGLGDEDVEEKRYWIYSPGKNASKWTEYSKEGLMGIGWGEMGDLSVFESRSEMRQKMQEVFNTSRNYKMDSLATWQFVQEVKPGDIVYAKKGMYKIVGRGVVTSDYFYDDGATDEYKNFRKIDWKDIGEWDHPGKAVMKTLTDITAYTDYVEKLESLFVDTEEDVEVEEEKSWPEYNKEKFLEEVYIDGKSYDTLVGLILNKKNVILQGAPGVGKTYAANRLAYSIIGEKNKDQVMMVQFHQSYSYEDFIEGFRPSSDSNGFEIKKGVFYNFCKKAAEDEDNKYFFIIDEINRGNLSKIFGELFMLIEKDKRGNALQLLYSDEKFFVPSNVYIIGMMNTADRSLAMLDYALRRRFAFYEMKPAFDQAKFIQYRLHLDNTKFNNLIECVKKLNTAIKDDSSLGEGFCIGHSYFCDLKNITDSTLNSIVEYELIPLLKEYWFDDQTLVRDWSEKLRSAIK